MDQIQINQPEEIIDQPYQDNHSDISSETNQKINEFLFKQENIELFGTTEIA